jgi:chorismate mutase / prephenate dehydratase
MDMKIAYLGPLNTFTEKAARELFPNEEYIVLQPIIKVVQSVEQGNADFGVIPLENYYNGEVKETLDSLKDTKKITIIKEYAIKIEHSLGALKNHIDIKNIYSKDTALEQCSKYIYKNYPEAQTLSTHSTTDAIERIYNENLIDSAAIADKEALIKKGFIIIDKDLCPNNSTKFIVIGTKKTKPSGDDKTLVIIHPKKDYPGSLQVYLSFFSNLNINLNYIQSRPDGLGGYYFYIELIGHIDDTKVDIALKGLRYALDPLDKNPDSLKILGSYPKIDWKIS